MRQRDKKRNPHTAQDTGKKRSGDPGQMAGIGGSAQGEGQNAAECSSGKGSAGLLHSECLRFGLTTARPHGPWWCRKLGIASEDRQGKAAGTCLWLKDEPDEPDEVSCRRSRVRLVRPWLSQSAPAWVQPGWDETKAAVAGCKRSNRSRRTRSLGTSVPCLGKSRPALPWHSGTVGTHLWHTAAGTRQERGRSSVVGRRSSPSG